MVQSVHQIHWIVLLGLIYLFVLEDLINMTCFAALVYLLVLVISAGLPCSTVSYVVFSSLALIALVDLGNANVLHSVASDVSYGWTAFGVSHEF